MHIYIFEAMRTSLSWCWTGEGVLEDLLESGVELRDSIMVFRLMNSQKHGTFRSNINIDVRRQP